jgi:hypothetical protein
MPQFVIEREVPGAGSLSEAELREISLQSLRTVQEMGPQIQWLHSYVTEDKIYCVYLAPDESSVREHAKKAGIPANRVSMVRHLVDPTKLA